MTPPRRSLRIAISASLAGILAASTGGAQERTTCTMEQLLNSRVSGNRLPSGESNTFVGGGLLVRCPSRRITLKADSAEIYGDEKRVFLVGHVSYDEPRLHLTSDYLTYYTAEERILAAGNVDARLPTGSRLRGPQVDYRRAVPRVRTRAQTTAIGRPNVLIAQQDRQGKEEPPIDVVANTIYMDGDSLIYGSGAVEIKRPEINATSDSAFINTGAETMQLMRNPVVQGTRGRQFRLVGERVDLFSRERKLQRVLSRASAVASSQDLTLRSDTIDLRISNDQLERAFAWGASRARATSPTQNMIADSIDVRMPNQRVREVRSIGHALAEGRADSVRFRADTTDWLRGDRILASFDSLAAVDTTKGPAIRRLVAEANASAYYHLAPQDTTLRRPAISYVTGRRITIDFDDQRVATIRVEQQVAGVYIEPTADTSGARPAPRRGTTTPPARPGTVPPASGVRRP